MSVWSTNGFALEAEDGLTFGPAPFSAPIGDLDDNHTHITTSDGSPSGTVLEVWKYDEETSSWTLIGPDTDIAAFNQQLTGTNLVGSITEDGVTITTTADLSSIADTDVSGVAIAAGPNSLSAAPTIVVTVTEDGVAVGSNEYTLPVNPACPLPMTRTALLALRAAGSLRPECHYTITDYNRGTVGTASIQLHAVDPSTLSMDVSVLTAFDTLAWDGRYDIDSNRLTALKDNIDNEVVGPGAVDTFPWGVATVIDNRVHEGRLTYTAGTVQGVTIGRNSTVNMVAGVLRESTVDGDSDLTIRSGDNYELRIENSSNLNQFGTGYIRRTTVANESTVTVGDASMNDNVFERTIFNSTGAAGSVNYNRFHRSSITVTNVPTLRIDSNSFAANSQVAANGAARFDVRYGTFSGFARLLVTAGMSLFSQYDGIRDYGYIQVLQGFLASRYCSISNVGYVQHNTPGSNLIDSTTVSARARVRFLGTSTACRVYYSAVSSGSFIEHRGTSNNCYIYYCQVSSSSGLFSDNSVNARIYYNTLSGNSEMYSRAVTGTHYIYYSGCTAHGYIRFENAPAGRIYAVHCHGQGLLRFRPASAAGRVYYSSFTAYFYLYADAWTATRTALHGHGRQTYTVTNPANGTPNKNF